MSVEPKVGSTCAEKDTWEVAGTMSGVDEGRKGRPPDSGGTSCVPGIESERQVGLEEDIKL